VFLLMTQLDENKNPSSFYEAVETTWGEYAEETENKTWRRGKNKGKKEQQQKWM